MSKTKDDLKIELEKIVDGVIHQSNSINSKIVDLKCLLMTTKLQKNEIQCEQIKGDIVKLYTDHIECCKQYINKVNEMNKPLLPFDEKSLIIFIITLLQGVVHAVEMDLLNYQ